MSERDNDSDESAGGGRPGFPIDLLRVWLALRARWQLLAVATVVGAFIGAAVAKKMVSQSFASRAVITWEANQAGSDDPVERATIVESVTLGSNLELVKKRMKLDMPTSSLVDFVSVGSNPRSNLISIDALWATPEGASDLANALVDVFLEQRANLVRDRISSEVNRYRTAVAQAEKKHAAAAAAYEKFRREHGITDISQERQLAIQQVAELSAQADSARAQAQAAKSELDKISAGSTQPVPTAPVLSASELARADADERRLSQARQELDSARIQFSDEHPTVRRLMAEIAALEGRVKVRSKDGTRKLAGFQQQASSAAARQKAAEGYQAQLRERLNKLSAVEGQAAVLLGELTVEKEALDSAKGMLTAAELQATKPASEFRVLERAKPAEIALASPRKRVALGLPIAALVLSALGVLVWSFRKVDVRTPKEAAFWSNVPVIGASTWPRDQDMLSSLMHDLDDYAPHCEGVTLIVGVSLEEAHLARRVAEWDGHRMPKTYDPQKLLMGGVDASSAAPLALRDRDAATAADATPPSMQILTLTGPVPAQALRRAARLADRVLVVALSGRHSIFQMMKIRSRLGRESGIGLLLVGLDKEFAMVRDRVGEIERFWHATRAAGGRAEA